MRILLVNTYYSPEIMGGAEYSVKKLAESLKAGGHVVEVLCTGSFYKKEIIDGIDVVRIVPHNVCRAINIDSASKIEKLVHRLQDIKNKRNKDRIEQVINSFNPDVIHTNGLYDITPIIWEIAANKKIRLVHTIRDYHLMCPRVVLTCNKRTELCTEPLAYCKVHRFFNKKQSCFVNCVTAPSQKTLGTLLECGFFENASSRVIPNAIDYDEEELKLLLRKREQKNVDLCKFVYIGMLSEQKGVKWLIDSFNSLRNTNAELYIAGKGPLDQYVIDSAKTNKHIHYMGFLKETDVNSLLQECDVVVCPSLWQEPFGRVVLDAYKNAMPIIVSNRGALSEIVSDRVTGLVIDPNQDNSLSQAMQYLIDNPNAIIEYARHAIVKIQEYNLDRQVASFEDCYNIRSLRS